MARTEADFILSISASQREEVANKSFALKINNGCNYDVNLIPKCGGRTMTSD